MRIISLLLLLVVISAGCDFQTPGEKTKEEEPRGNLPVSADVIEKQFSEALAAAEKEDSVLAFAACVENGLPNDRVRKVIDRWRERHPQTKFMPVSVAALGRYPGEFAYERVQLTGILQGSLRTGPSEDIRDDVESALPRIVQPGQKDLYIRLVLSDKQQQEMYEKGLRPNQGLVVKGLFKAEERTAGILTSARTILVVDPVEEWQSQKQ